MKKSYLILGLLTLGFTTTFAQRSIGTKIDDSEKFNRNFFLQTEAVNDTIAPGLTSTCSGAGPYLIGSSNGGYVSGTNGYGDLEKAQALYDAGRGNVYSVMALFGGKTAGDGNGSFMANLYAVTPTGPGYWMGTSQPVPFSSIDTTGSFTMFNFATPVPYAWNFFASVVVDKAGNSDSVGIYHTDFDCGGGTAWELWSDNSWVAMSDANGWGLDVVFYIFAEVDMTFVGNNEFLIQRGSHKVFPNPAKNQAHLIYSLVNDASNVDVAVYNVSGQQVANYARGAENSGLHGFDLNIQDLAAGTYMYTITSDGDVAQGKFVVAE